MTAPAALTGSIEVKGIDEIDRKLRDLELSTSKGILRRGLRKGADIVRDEARRLAPRRTGRLEASINVKGVKRSREGRVGVRVTTEAATFVGDTFYSGFQEWGWLAGKRGRGGRINVKGGRVRNLAIGNARRRIPGEHYMEYSLKDSLGTAVQAIVDSWRSDIERVMASGGA